MKYENYLKVYLRKPRKHLYAHTSIKSKYAASGTINLLTTKEELEIMKDVIKENLESENPGTKTFYMSAKLIRDVDSKIDFGYGLVHRFEPMQPDVRACKVVIFPESDSNWYSVTEHGITKRRKRKSIFTHDQRIDVGFELGPRIRKQLDTMDRG